MVIRLFIILNSFSTRIDPEPWTVMYSKGLRKNLSIPDDSNTLRDMSGKLGIGSRVEPRGHRPHPSTTTESGKRQSVYPGGF